MTVWGDFFNHDTRALLAICDIAGVSVRFEEVNTFKGHNMNSTYTSLNSLSSIPMITQGVTKVIGTPHALYSYMMNKHPEVFSMLGALD